MDDWYIKSIKYMIPALSKFHGLGTRKEQTNMEKLETYVNTTTGVAYARCPRCGRPVQVDCSQAPFDPMDTAWDCGRCPNREKEGMES